MKSIGEIPVKDAVGLVLAHDLTKIVPGGFKGVRFRKGYVLKKEDIGELEAIGKNHIRVFEPEEDELLENDAADSIARALCGDGIRSASVGEGKCELVAARDGLLCVNTRLLDALNCVGDFFVASVQSGRLVKKGDRLSVVKIVPLTLKKEQAAQAGALAQDCGPLLTITPLRPLRVGVVVTGTEVFEGRIEDKFGGVLKEKVEALGGSVIGLSFAPDDRGRIVREMQGLLEKGAQLLLVSGGMAVDADDCTPAAIREIASEVVSYGAPVVPGSLLMTAYRGDVPVFGIPASGMFFRATSVDLLLPKAFAGVRITRRDIIALAHGGLCLRCQVCRFPDCPYGAAR